MNYIEFAENERLSTIVLGMMRISQMSEDEVEALVEAALSIGINTFDLADIYGDGQCEVLLGKVLKRRPDLRNQMWIQSKCGIRKDGFTYFDFSKDYILDSVDGILDRLQIERLDSLLLLTDRMPSWNRKKWQQLLISWSKRARFVILGCPIKIP